MNQDQITLSFHYEFDETYVVLVEVNDTPFFVNCQFATNHNYTLTNNLECINESGGDYYDSGLHAYLASLDSDLVEWYDEEFKEALVARINAFAQEQVGDTSVKAYLEEETGINDLKFEKSLAGACYANNCSLRKYIGSNDEVVISDEDDNYIRANEIVDSFRIFDSKEEYQQWWDEATEGWDGHWSGDCGLALRLKNAL